MRFRFSLAIFLTACVALVAPRAFAQETTAAQAEEDESMTVRGVFFATRPGGASKKSATAATSSTNRTRTNSGARTPATVNHTGGRISASGSTKISAAKNSNADPKRQSAAAKRNDAQATSKSNSAASKNASIVKASLPPAGAIGLGYTLYMQDASGGAVRVDPAREFKAGDRIRIALETNSDGYLYIFHTEDGRNPQMLYPDVRLNNGNNDVRAHVPYQVPSSLNDWFKFDAVPARERLYIVVAREPLPGIPAGEELKTLAASRMPSQGQATIEQIIAHCNRNAEPCVWRPTETAWAQVAKAERAPAAIEKSVEFGQLQTSAERDATTRGISLSQDEPAPSVVRMNASSNSNLLVTVIDLVHK